MPEEVVRVTVENFRPWSSNLSYCIHPAYLRIHEGYKELFTCRVDLPEGRRIEKFLYYHRGEPGRSPFTRASLQRFALGGEGEEVCVAISDDDSGEAVQVSTEDIHPDRAVIDPDNYYFISVRFDGDQSEVRGFEIHCSNGT